MAVLVGSWLLVAFTVTVWFAGIGVGAVYKPLAEIVPTPAGVTDQVAATVKRVGDVAVNCCVCPARSDAVEGATEMVGGGESVIVVVRSWWDRRR